ncbi:MAG TPA: hypothetical protein VGJ94_12275 [Syntrophorhabdaceae bacterium]|jgi:hypothetical protein
MHTIRQEWNPAEVKGVIDGGNGIPGFETTPHGAQDPLLMNNLYSILTLSLFFYDRITRPFDGREDDRVVSYAQESGIGS